MRKLLEWMMSYSYDETVVYLEDRAVTITLQHRFYRDFGRDASKQLRKMAEKSCPFVADIRMYK